MRRINIKVEKIHPDAVIPQFAHDTDSGFDLFSCEDVEIQPGETVVIPTGLKFEMPYGYGIQIKNKSGITVKGVPVYSYIMNNQNLSVIDKVILNERAPITTYEGTIDMMYRGEIGIMIRNEQDTEKSITIPKQTKIAQGVIREVITCDFIEVDKISTNTSRGEKGYGSTGTTIK